MFANIKTDQNNGIPIYKQIGDCINQAVSKGELPAGYKLPTVRELAEEIKICKEIALDNNEDIRNLFKMTPYYYKTGKADQEKLNNLKEKEQKENQDKLKGIQMDIAWGSQIRSYVFCPYTLVKDNRTSFQNPAVEEVMDGDLDDFIFAYLEQEAKDGGVKE